MYKYSFPGSSNENGHSSPCHRIRPLPPPRHARRTRVAIAGATGYAGQELVRLLARHPAVTLTAAMSSGASSTPRPLPALARIWDGAVVPLDIDRLVASADIVFLALPEAASADVAPQLLERGVARHRSLRRVSNPRRRAIASAGIRRRRRCPAGTAYGLPERDRGGDQGCAARVVSRLLSDRGAARARAAVGCRPHRRGADRHRRQVGHLRRRQGAERPHALLREPRQRRGVRRLLASSQRRDRAGAAARR